MKRFLVAILIIVIIIGGIIIGAALLGLLGPLSANMSGQWYYEGEKVGTPFAFVANGQPVDELRMTVSWTATASGADTSTFNLLGLVSVYLITPGQDIILDAQTFSASGADAMQSSATKIFDIVDKLSNYMDMKDTGWNLKITGSLSATINDQHSGEQRETTWKGSTNYHIDWSDGDFTLSGSVGV